MSQTNSDNNNNEDDANDNYKKNHNCIHITCFKIKYTIVNYYV